MKQPVHILIFVGIVLFAFVSSGCSTLLAAPTPVILVVTATAGPLPPTLTPLPMIASSTSVSSVIPALPPIIPASPTATPNLPQPTNAPTPTNPPPPPQPAATPNLPRLAVVDQGGGNMDVFIFGGQIGKTLLVRAVACAPNCKNWPDGRDVNNVQFTFNRCTAGGSVSCDQTKKVFDHTENNAPYCSFGGSDQCDYLNVSDRNAKWPGTNTVIENGDYLVQVVAKGKNTNWQGSVQIKIQR